MRIRISLLGIEIRILHGRERGDNIVPKGQLDLNQGCCSKDSAMICGTHTTRWALYLIQEEMQQKKMLLSDTGLACQVWATEREHYFLVEIQQPHESDTEHKSNHLQSLVLSYLHNLWKHFSVHFFIHSFTIVSHSLSLGLSSLLLVSAALHHVV